jgi:K+-sensing histidine kinase KdpD
MLHIIYEDNGVGISEQHKETLFDFSLTKKDKNALFIAREILSITDISIKEDGTDEGGARFVITVKPGWFRLRK